MRVPRGRRARGREGSFRAWTGRGCLTGRGLTRRVVLAMDQAPRGGRAASCRSTATRSGQRASRRICRTRGASYATLPSMNTGTKWIIGTGVAVIASVVGSAVAVIAVVVTLVGGVREDVRASQAAVDGLRDDMQAAVDGLRDDMREDHARFDARLAAVEVAFGKVDQRLLTIERVVLPAPEQPSE